MFKLKTLNHMLSDLWTAGPLVPSAAIFALLATIKKMYRIGF